MEVEVELVITVVKRGTLQGNALLRVREELLAIIVKKRGILHVIVQMQRRLMKVCGFVTDRYRTCSN